jgi:hypothetical protein
LIAVNFPPLDRGIFPPFSMRMSSGTMKAEEHYRILTRSSVPHSSRSE